jgi:hypothetical protein
LTPSLYCFLLFIDDLTDNTPGFFADECRLEVTKLFFFKECLHKTNNAMDPPFPLENDESISK